MLKTQLGKATKTFKIKQWGAPVLLLALGLGIPLTVEVVHAEETVAIPIQTQNATAPVTATWGTSPVSFDPSTGILTVSAGTLANDQYNYYIDSGSTISKIDIKEINFMDGVILPSDCSRMFGTDFTGGGGSITFRKLWEIWIPLMLRP